MTAETPVTWADAPCAAHLRAIQDWLLLVAPEPEELVVGLARCNEPREVLRETLDAILAGTRVPERILLIDNGDVALDQETVDSLLERHGRVCVARPESNLGCAASWNLIWHWAGRATAIILNADLAVAAETIEQVADATSPTALLAYGFGCFRIDHAIREIVGPLDEAFYPVYLEDADYRRRLRLAGIAVVEWPTRPAVAVRPGRERAESGIAHGKHDPDGYQGWRGDRLAWFHARVAANRARYLQKWGGEPSDEVYRVPFGGLASQGA